MSDEFEFDRRDDPVMIHGINRQVAAGRSTYSAAVDGSLQRLEVVMYR